MAQIDNKIKNPPRLILASASPRRSFFLKELGLNFEVCPTDIDEKIREGETPVEFTKRLAVEKALAGIKSPLAPLFSARGGSASGGQRGGKYPPPFEKGGLGGISGPIYSLGADTVVVLGGKIYGKPRHKTEAMAFWRELGGKTHEVITAFAIAGFPDRMVCVETVSSAVTLKKPSGREIREYLATGEPLDKAGAYAAQGIGKKFVEKIGGSVTNVIGLPLEALIPWLKKLGLIA